MSASAFTIYVVKVTTPRAFRLEKCYGIPFCLDRLEESRFPLISRFVGMCDEEKSRAVWPERFPERQKRSPTCSTSNPQDRNVFRPCSIPLKPASSRTKTDSIELAPEHGHQGGGGKTAYEKRRSWNAPAMGFQVRKVDV